MSLTGHCSCTSAWQQQRRWAPSLALVTSCGNECGRQEKFGERSSEYAGTLINMGIVYQRKGDLDRAAELFEQSADITKVQHSLCAADSHYSCCVQEVNGEQSRAYGGKLVNTAQVLMRKGDHNRALPMLQQACGIFEVPCDCPQVLPC